MVLLVIDATTPRNILLAALNKRSPTTSSVVKLVPAPATVNDPLEVVMIPVLFALIVIVPVLLTLEVIVPACAVPIVDPTATPGVNVTMLVAVNPPLASKATVASALSEDLLTLIAGPVYAVLSLRKLNATADGVEEVSPALSSVFWESNGCINKQDRITKDRKDFIGKDLLITNKQTT